MSSKNLDLKEIRDRIDTIDSELVKLLEERLEIVSDVAQYKKENNKKIFDKQREDEVIEKNTKKVEKQEHSSYIEKMLIDLMNVSKEYQKYKIGEKYEYINNINFNNSKVGYTGVQGSYANEVMINLLENYIPENDEGKNYEYFNFKSHEDLVTAVSNGDVDYAVIPVENTITGEVRDTVDLINEKDVYIVGEIKHKIEHKLLGLENTTIDKIEKVFSHEQALLQCSKFLNNHENIEQIAMSNTAVSAKFIKSEGNEAYACIAGKKAQEIYGLKILLENISNITENYTRFIILSNKMIVQDNADKVSIITSTSNEVGSLFKLLEIFSMNDLNMTSIKSRPIINKPWEYYFYIDFDGNLKDERVKDVLEKIRNNTSYLKVLGNYTNYNQEL